jgi:23S rRNA pseudouridine2604 synthase
LRLRRDRAEWQDRNPGRASRRAGGRARSARLSRTTRRRLSVRVPPLRLNKFISETGVCSRRQADDWIAAGRVTVNGDVAALGTQVTDEDIVEVDRKPVARKPRRIYIALNKPVGIECTTNRSVRDNIVDFVAHPERLFPVGRLDKDSEGLILLTNDGDIVNQILRAENRHQKEYLVAVNKPVSDEFLRGMARGVRVHNETTLPCRTARIAKFGFRIVLEQGLNRQIRLMAAAFDYRVTQLRRVRIDNIKLGALKPGQWRNLTEQELRGLLPQRLDW